MQVNQQESRTHLEGTWRGVGGGNAFQRAQPAQLGWPGGRWSHPLTQLEVQQLGEGVGGGILGAAGSDRFSDGVGHNFLMF